VCLLIFFFLLFSQWSFFSFGMAHPHSLGCATTYEKERTKKGESSIGAEKIKDIPKTILAC